MTFANSRKDSVGSRCASGVVSVFRGTSYTTRVCVVIHPTDLSRHSAVGTNENAFYRDATSTAALATSDVVFHYLWPSSWLVSQVF